MSGASIVRYMKISCNIIIVDKQKDRAMNDEQQIDLRAVEERLQPVSDIMKALTEEVDCLTDHVYSFFFYDIDIERIEKVLPEWMRSAGRLQTNAMSKDIFDQMRAVYHDPISNRILYWYDMLDLFYAMNDRIVDALRYMRCLYDIVTPYEAHKDSGYFEGTMELGDNSRHAYDLVNAVCMSLCSVMDFLSKIVYECYHFDLARFKKYDRIRSRKEKILYTKHLNVYKELKGEGMLYYEPPCVKTVLAFREEYVHGGVWSGHYWINKPPEVDGRQEKFICAPDIDVTGAFNSAGGRNRFNACGIKVNIMLPDLVADVVNVLKNTVEKLEEVLYQKTAEDADDTETTEMYLKLLEEYDKVTHSRLMDIACTMRVKRAPVL